jgi:hypothetical protein
MGVDAAGERFRVHSANQLLREVVHSTGQLVTGAGQGTHIT